MKGMHRDEGDASRGECDLCSLSSWSVSHVLLDPVFIHIFLSVCHLKEHISIRNEKRRTILMHTAYFGGCYRFLLEAVSDIVKLST